MRKLARELAFKLVFASLFNEEAKSIDDLINKEDFLQENKLDEETNNYLCSLVNAVLEHKKELSDRIAKALNNTTIDRLYKCDYAVLLIGAGEYLYMNTPDLTKPIIVNEVVELAKKYGEDKSSKFVHGVLGQILKED